MFSGIGAFSLGLERAGMETMAFCEIDPFCRQVLKRHWPGIPCVHDVKELKVQFIKKFYGPIDLICGGFPCTDISNAGKRAGIGGPQSGLWKYFKEIVHEAKPKYAIIENVPALRSRGLGRVIKDLWEVGYSCQWHIIPAAGFGAPHLRERIWIIAYPGRSPAGVEKRGGGSRRRQTGDRPESQMVLKENGPSGAEGNMAGDGEVADTDGLRLEGLELYRRLEKEIAKNILRNDDSGRWRTTYWGKVEPPLYRIPDGPPASVDRNKRIRALGNSLVPQVAELIGRAIYPRGKNAHGNKVRR